MESRRKWTSNYSNVRLTSEDRSDGSISLPRRHRPDYMLLVLIAILLAVGLIVIYSISPGLSLANHVSQNYFIDKQLLAVGIGVIAFGVAAYIPLSTWKRLQIPLIIIAGISALAVRLIGTQVNGAYRWIQIKGVSFQSAELIKIALLIFLAGFLAERIKRDELADSRKTLRPVLIILAIIAVVVAGIQSDLGSTGVMIAMVAAMVYVAGMPLRKVITIGGVVLLLLVVAISMTPYRRSRLNTYLHPTADCLTTGYQSCQALIAVGSGGTLGLGLGRSVQAYGYLPEAANDSIFAIFSEKFGFVGSVLLVGLFGLFFARLKRLAEHITEPFSRLLIIGALAWLSVQTIINIGAMIGLLPLKGITLPFISYGGTSVVFVMLVMGIVFQVSHYSIYTRLTENDVKGSNNDYRLDGRRLRRSYITAPRGRA